ncbi:ABC transporter permease [Streptomyces massasporeus]|uniref:ABC transporter permease n=1 Tax=Streptomyces massasporeus TaxID=67324 RepID=UPI0036ED4C6F
MEPETFPEELADALVGVQRLIRRRLRRQMPDPRLRGAEVELLHPGRAQGGTRRPPPRRGRGPGRAAHAGGRLPGRGRDRLMGIVQAITMPLFFGSNALYPVSAMPGWLQAVSKATPLSYEADALPVRLAR